MAQNYYRIGTIGLLFEIQGGPEISWPDERMNYTGHCGLVKQKIKIDENALGRD